MLEYSEKWFLTVSSKESISSGSPTISMYSFVMRYPIGRSIPELPRAEVWQDVFPAIKSKGSVAGSSSLSAIAISESL